MAEAQKDNKIPGLTDNPDDGGVEATPRLINLVREILELRDLLRRLHLLKETGEGSYKKIEEDAKRNVPVEYTDKVRDALGPYSPEYLEFMDIMYYYQYRREGVLVTIGILRRVLKEHQDLLARFNDYLPDGFQIHKPGPDRPEYRRANQVIDILTKLQEKLELDEHRYLIFRYNLSEYYLGKKDISVLKRRTEDLFRKKPDVLILCFGLIDTLAAHVKSRDSNSDKVVIPFEDRKDDAKRNLPIEYTNSVLEPKGEEYGDFDSTMSSYLTESEESYEVPVKYTDSVRDALGPYSIEYLEFMDLMSLYQSRSKGILKTIMQLKELLKEHQDLLNRFNAYLPVGYHIPIAEPGKSEGRGSSTDFYIELQEKLQDDDSRYLSVQTLLGECHWGCKDTPTAKQEIHALLADRPDVAEICCNYVDEFLHTPSKPQMADNSKNVETRDKSPLIDIKSVENALGVISQKYRELLNLISQYKADRTGISEITSMLKDLMREDPELATEIADRLPEEEITPSDANHLADAAAFLGKVQREFAHDPKRFDSFQNILRAVEEHMDIEVAKQEVAALFHDRPDVFEEFLSFI